MATAARRQRCAQQSRATHRRAFRCAGRARAERRRGAAAAGSAGAVAVRQDRDDPAVARRQCRGRPSRGSHRQAGGAAGRVRFPPRPPGSDRARTGRSAGAYRGHARATRTAGLCARTIRRASTRSKHDIARTQDALEAVNGTLGHVVDRLVIDRKGYSRRGAHARRGRFRHPASSSDRSARSRSAWSAMRRRKPQFRPAGSRSPASCAASRRAARAQAPAGGRPAADQSRSAARSAARARFRSAAIYAPIRPRASPPRKQRLGGPARRGRPGGKSGFIAAARRAAQAAVAGAQRARAAAPNSSRRTRPSRHRCATK